MDDLTEKFSERLAEIWQRIAVAASRGMRDQESVRLVGITKYVTPEVATALHSAGLEDLGESRPQELWHKASAMPATVHWHLVGHLQRNKVEKSLPLVKLIHSVDSVRLLEAINAAAKQPVPVLLEVNMSGEAAKQGFDPDEMAAIGEVLPRLTNVQVQGLMTMAARDEAEATRTAFTGLRQLRDRLTDQWRMPLPELSMGMSGDFEIALEEGATIIRLGSVLFEGIV